MPISCCAATSPRPPICPSRTSTWANVPAAWSAPPWWRNSSRRSHRESAEALGPVRFHSCGTSTHLLGALTRDRPPAFAGPWQRDLDPQGTTRSSARRCRSPSLPRRKTCPPKAPTPILDWAQRVLEENAGGNLGYVFHLEPSYNVETIYALTDFVQHQTGGSEAMRTMNRRQNRHAEIFSRWPPAPPPCWPALQGVLCPGRPSRGRISST